jgi:23S rRNA A2030 N6-methylase RlmJ
MYDIHLIPECHAETEFAHAILYEFNRFKNHESGNARVSKVLQTSKLKAKVKIGFTDKDKKNVPPHLNQFVLIDEISNISFKHFSGSNQYLFVINPAIDKFIWDEMHSLDLSPSEFELPNDFDTFKKVLKKESIENNNGYKRLVKKLKSHNSQGVTFILNKVNSILNTESA